MKQFGQSAMKSDRVDFAVGHSASGAVDILMMPFHAGNPLLERPFAVTPELARNLAAHLSRMADQAEGKHLIGMPQIRKVV